VAPELCGGAPAGAVDRYGLRALVRQAAGRLAAAGVTSPQVDARISFLSASGEALPSTTLLRLPSSEDFLRGLQLPMSTASDRLRELLYPLHYELSWAQGTSAPTLIVRPTLLLSEEDKQSDELKTLIAQLPALTTTWGGQSFAPFVRATNP